MHQNLILEKHTNAYRHKTLKSQIAPSKSNKHLDYQLKEKEAQLIKSKLPIGFLLVNLENDELHKYQEEYKGNDLKNGLFASKLDIMQQKKNEKKNETQEKNRISYDMNMSKIKENYGFEKEGKSMGEESLMKKLPRQKTEENNNGLINETRNWGNEPMLARYQNEEKLHFYKQNNNFIPEIQHKHYESQHLETPRNFSEIYSQGLNDMQSNHEMLPMKYPYLNNYHENLHYYSPVYQIPFLQSGELRYNQKYFEPKEGESTEKNNLFRLFGLPFNEKHIEAPKLNDVQKTFCLNFLHKLLLHHSSEIFRSPVSPQFQRVPDYHYIIYQPMDLQTIDHKIKKDAYREISEFHGDINKIIVSSYKYNERGSPSFVATVEFEDYYFEILKEVKRCPEDFVNEHPEKNKTYSKEEKEKEYLAQFNLQKKGDNVSSTESNGRSEKNLKSTKVSKEKAYYEDDNSQVFYQDMISEPNYHEYQQENMINHISAESERKGNVMVHHRKYVKTSSNNSMASSEIYQPASHENYQPNNANMKLCEKKDNKSMKKKKSLEDNIMEETRKEIEKSNFSQNIKKSSLIKEQNERLQQFMKNQENYQRNEEEEEIDNLKHFKFDLDENSMQTKSVNQPSENNTHKNIQRPLLFRSEISFDKLDKLEEDPKEIKQSNNKMIQFPSNIPTTNITRKPSSTHISKEDDDEEFEIPSKIELFDCEPSLKKSTDEQTKKIELSIPLEAVRMIEELDKEQEEKNEFHVNSAVIKNRSSKGELLEYIALLDTESNKYKSLQKESEAPQTNAPLQETDTHLHQSNLGHIDIDPSYQTVARNIKNEIGVKERAKKKRRILDSEENSDESGYDEYLQKELQKLEKSKRVQKIRNSEFKRNNSSEQEAQKRREKNIKRVENVKKMASLPNHQEMPINVNQAMSNFYNFPSQISLEEPKNQLLPNQTKNNVQSISFSHQSEHNQKEVPVEHPKDIFMEKDQNKDNVDEPGIDFTDFFL